MRHVLLAVLLMMWPVAALALPETPYDPQTIISYQALTDEQQQVFDLLYQAAAQGQARVELPRGTGYDDASLAMAVLVRDCPELCALANTWSVGYWVNEPQVATYVELQYEMPLWRQQELVEAARGVTDGACGGELAREVYLHDALCQRVVYDLTAVNAHNAWGALMEGRAVCDGYASAMALLLRLSDIPCSVVTGAAADGAAHAWNIVQVEGSFAWLDVTSDDQPAGRVYDWFNLTDDWMLSHYLVDADQEYPACNDESINWHVRTCRVVDKAEDMPLHIFNNYRNLLADGTEFMLRFRCREDFLHYINNTAGWVERFMQADQVDFVPSMQLFINEKQQCITVKKYNEKTIVDSGEK